MLLKGDEVEEADTRTMLADPQEDYTKSLWAVRSFKRPKSRRPTHGHVPVISVKNVTAAYGKIPVLYDVSFDIHEGPDRGRGGRKRLGQIDHRALHHRASAAP